MPQVNKQGLYLLGVVPANTSSYKTILKGIHIWLVQVELPSSAFGLLVTLCWMVNLWDLYQSINNRLVESQPIV